MRSIFGFAGLAVLLLGVWWCRWRRADMQSPQLWSSDWSPAQGLGIGFLSLSCYLWSPWLLYRSFPPGDALYTTGWFYFLSVLWSGLPTVFFAGFLWAGSKVNLLDSWGFRGRPGRLLTLWTLIGIGLDEAWAGAYMALDKMSGVAIRWGVVVEAMLWGSPAVVIADVLNSMVFAPIFEEIIFRGMLYGSLRMRWGVMPSMIVTSLLFAGTHGYDWLGTLSVFASGLIFALVYERSRSLVPGILVHGFVNLTATLFNGVW